MSPPRTRSGPGLQPPDRSDQLASKLTDTARVTRPVKTWTDRNGVVLLDVELDEHLAGAA